jgi:hypothetical protein
VPKKERKRLQVVISDQQDALLTRAAYELSNPERLVSKSEVVRLAIESIAKELQEGKSLEGLLASLAEEDEEDEDGALSEDADSKSLPEPERGR